MRASKDSLAEAQVLVIANSLAEANVKKWKLPTPSAFGDDEVAAIVEWVEGGGSLLLIADHMPFPGATADLAEAFGIFFSNGFALPTDREAGEDRVLGGRRFHGGPSDRSRPR